MKHSTFFGHNIYRNNKLGFSLKWETYLHGTFLRSDSLEGIRQMIRELR
jgi:hypothetical protein